MKNLMLALVSCALMGCQSNLAPEPENMLNPEKRVLSITSTTAPSDLPQVLLPGLELKVFAGSGKAGYKDGPALEAAFNSPTDLTQDAQGNLYIVDLNNYRVRKIDQLGQVSTLAGTGETGDQRNTFEHLGKVGAFSETEFLIPRAIEQLSSNRLLVDDGDKIIQLNLQTQESSIFAKERTDFTIDPLGKLYSGPPVLFVSIGAMLVKTSRIFISGRYGIYYFEKQANGYYLDRYAGDAIINPNHDSAEAFFRDGPIDQSVFNKPTDLAFDQEGNMYVADQANQRIRKIDAQTQVVSTLSGQGFIGPTTSSISQYFEGAHKDGALSEAHFDYPGSLAVLGIDQLLVCDSGDSHSLRWIRQGQVKTIIQKFSCSRMFRSAETLYLTDVENHQIYTLDLKQLDALAPDFFTQENTL